MGEPSSALIAWLLAPETRRLACEDLLDQLCGKLLELGVPVWRVNTSERTLHPEVYVRNLVWLRDRGTSVFVRQREILDAPAFRESPIATLYQGRNELRRPLAGPDAVLDFPICRELAAEGGTDYLVQRLAFQRSMSFVSWATDAPGGFSDDHIATLAAIRPALEVVIELSSAYYATRSLLEVYLGQNAAREVLSGAVTRGTSKRLQAAIFFCDLRGFTSMADRRPPSEVIAVLDRYLERVVEPIAEHGGEVLKFIGDAVLAIFPVEDGNSERACRSALAAARGALGAEEIRLGEEEPLRFGIALHLGEVSYGNIGGRGRLDFTVIGAAVNEASRVEALCKELERTLLVTAAFAAACPAEGLRSLGQRRLRGVAEPSELFTIDEG